MDFKIYELEYTAESFEISKAINERRLKLVRLKFLLADKLFYPIKGFLIAVFAEEFKASLAATEAHSQNIEKLVATTCDGSIHVN